MQTRTKSLILLVEMENGELHQAMLTKAQQDAIKALLKALPDSVQLISTPLSGSLPIYPEQ